MKGNLRLGTLFGIKINVHWTFFFLILWIVILEIKNGGTSESILFNLALIISVFACVVFHELGHSLAAKKFGIETKKITLLPIGGVASLDKIPENPRQELIVAVSGPLVNVVIALVLYFFIPMDYFFTQNSSELLDSLSKLTLRNFLFSLFIINLGLILFNMIPAFPMDGGRVLRALLAMNMDRVKATNIASRIGQIIAILFLLVGLVYNPFLILIALFVFIGAYGENLLVHHLAILEGYKVKDAMLTSITKFKPKSTLDEVIETILAGTETNFVVINEEVVVGILYHEDIINRSKERTMLVEDLMQRSFKTFNTNDLLNNIYRDIYSKRTSFYPVVENNSCVGAIDHVNLNEFIQLQSKLTF